MAFDGYLQIEGIKGDSTDGDHLQWFQLISFSHNVATEVTGNSAGGSHIGGRCHHADITVVKSIDGSSPTLMQGCCQGTAYPTAVIELCHAGAGGKTPYQKIELTEVVITSVTPQALQGSDFPCETLTLHYSTIKWTYTITDALGGQVSNVVGTWNVDANQIIS